MREITHTLYARSLAALVALAVIVYALVEVWSDPAPLLSGLGILLALTLPAVLAGRLSTLPGASRTTRASLTFILAALAVLPTPGALLVAMAAAASGRGGGVAGPGRRGVASFAAMAMSVAIAGYLAGMPGPMQQTTELLVLIRLSLLFVVIQVFSFGLSLAMAGDVAEAGLDHAATEWRAALIEASNVPAAWILAGLLSRKTWLPALGLCALVLLAHWVTIRLRRSQQRLHRTETSLSARMAELSTLHAIGREILSSIEPERVFSILERECRKIFDVDFCMVALTDHETSNLNIVFRRRRGEAAELGGAIVGRGLAASVAEHRRPRRIDDVRAFPVDSPMRGDTIDPTSRSAMAVPLIVEDRVTGVISIQSRREKAYDDHQLAVLTTIAQQAAVAIENARHYQMATVDSLTGFFVRDYFFRRLDEEDKRVRRYGGDFGLLMVDLDGFKEINDSNGHLAGDQYLSEISGTIREQLRAADLPCRFGGDEFCLLLPETDLAGARAIAERIRRAVSRRIVGVEGLALRTTVSIGVAAFAEHDTGDLRGLMRKADEALYRAKRAGRDRVVPFAA